MKMLPGVGSTDVFIPQQPHASWTISTTEAIGNHLSPDLD